MPDNSHQRSGSGEVPVWPDQQTLPNWVLSGLPSTGNNRKDEKADRISEDRLPVASLLAYNSPYDVPAFGHPAGPI